MQTVNHKKNIIEVENVSFSYGKTDSISNISLDIHQGDYLALVGPNGAGKTTLLKIMVGLLKPKQGNVKLFGKDIKDFKEWKKIGYVSQKAVNFDQSFPITALEVVLMGRYAGLFKKLTAGDREKAINALKFVGMGEYGNRLLSQLSGGEQQKVFIARAIAGEPEVIFLDEPTSGVDKKSQNDFYALLSKMNTELGITLVLVSHDIDMVAKVAMHIACINKTLVCHSSPEEFIKESMIERIGGQEVKIITHHH